MKDNTFVFASAGPVTYYMLYHSCKLDRVVFQIDYNAARDSVSPGVVFVSAATIPMDTGHAILSGGLELCPPRFKILKALATGCIACPPGFYTIEFNQTDCIGCPLGTFGGKNGICEACVVGKSNFGGAADNTNCLLCYTMYQKLDGQIDNGVLLSGVKLIQNVQRMSGCSDFQPAAAGPVVVTTPAPAICGTGVQEGVCNKNTTRTLKYNIQIFHAHTLSHTHTHTRTHNTP